MSKSINPVGIDFTVRDFQVVNGCQTSHILHKNKDLLKGNEFITIKLIETEDVELTNKITKATNRQTEVTLEAFAGLHPFQKELEAFYASFPNETKLFYERRPGQYDFDPLIPHAKVISIPNQIKAFVSVFLEEPHKIHFYYGQLLEEYSSGNESTLFSDTHDPYPYYLSSRLAFLVNERLKRKDVADKKWRYHLSAMIRLLAGGPFNKTRLSDSAFCKRYCESLSTEISGRFDALYDRALEILRKRAAEARANSRSERDLPQDSKFARQLLDDCRSEYLGHNQQGSQQGASSESFNGIFLGSIEQVVPEKGFGFITYGQRRFYFKLDQGGPQPGARVRFKVRKAGQDAEAFDVVKV